MADKEYIERGALIAEYDRVHVGAPGGARKLMVEAPAADVVEVVRCKDCKYRLWFCPGYGCGNFNSPFYAGAEEDVPIMTQQDDFCSYGERKEETT